MKWGLMIVGVQGATASTLVATLNSPMCGDPSFRLGSYWCSLIGDYPEEIKALSLAGWDYRYDDFRAAVRANGLLPDGAESEGAELKLFRAIVGPSDYAVRVEGLSPTHRSLSDAVSVVRENIQTFRTMNNLDHIIVINLSSPMYCGGVADAGWASISAYASAAIEEGADWVEFTPSDSVTDLLLERANHTGSRVAGRDGSTGQTILKTALRDFFVARGLIINSWYSTNLIGNRDGLVLSHDDYLATKLRDKKRALSGYIHDDAQHLVQINYAPSSGDNKESWDCIHFTGWLGKQMSLRVNWHGADSFLAAPLLLDIVSGLIHAEKTGHAPGIVSSLGLLFKNPIGTDTTKMNDLLDMLEAFIRS